MRAAGLLTLITLSFVPLVAVETSGGLPADQSSPAARRGTIKGHVQLLGKLPGNPVIRMGMDPMCAKLNAGKLTVQETVMVTRDGSLANTFVSLQGSFPPAPVPAESVTIDQQGCIYRPRVVGVRVGQPLQIRNSDDLLHNLHALSARGNSFNISEPKAGMVQQFRLKDEEVMLRIKCDVHSWMTAYVGVVAHPYFSVSGTDGSFEIANVPPGTYTIRAWHERYGPLTQSVRVQPGGTATVNFAYTGSEKPPAVGFVDAPLSQILRAVG
jgi:hypothetical protein